MARPPRRSHKCRQERRRRRRRLYILTKHYGDGGSRIYKLNEDDFDSDDAFSEHSHDSDSDDAFSERSDGSCSSSSSADSSWYTYSEDSCFTASDDTEYSGSTSDNSSDSGSSSSDESHQAHFDSEYDVDSRARRLRHRRLVVRLGKQGERPEFLAAGTKIIGLNANASSYRATDVSFAFDAATRAVSAAPPFQSPKKYATFWAAGGAIYALDLDRRDACGGESPQGERCLFERLGPEPRGGRGTTWRWEALPTPPPFGTSSVFPELKSRAVHPGGGTALLSFHGAGTFSFDGERWEWARLGGWLLPFDGEAFYVRGVGAWVGLCRMHTGRLAACLVVEGRRAVDEPKCKCGKDVLFRHNWRRHVDANLVYDGKSKFCLLETVDTDTSSCPILLRLVTFRVQYSFDGELCVVDKRSRVYELPPHSTGQKPLAFWV